ncbi:VanW family protein [Candidatus Gottesmanbacteria bacterium]|nr:VanW family protein [Candidatus Gottesmanbacteria bacterium]
MKRKKYTKAGIKINRRYNKGVIYTDNSGRGFNFLAHFSFFLLGGILGLLLLFAIIFAWFEKTYQNRIYPGVKIEGVNFGGQSKAAVEKYFQEKSQKFDPLYIVFTDNTSVATISARDLNLSYNGKLLAEQAYLLGRSGHLLTDLFLKLKALNSGVALNNTFYLNDQNLDKILNPLAQNIDLAPQDALFKFSSGRVVAFRTSVNGRRLDLKNTKKLLHEKIASLNKKFEFPQSLMIALPIETVYPKVTTEKTNDLGISELIGRGSSTFYHSIENRVYNIGLAASRLNGILIPPNTTFSFNEALGDVSGLTGYKQAYVIKEGKTILGDGGGVCQVSTTLFRAALNAGLEIVERWPHSYRVGYYEQDQPPGLDATVYAPSNDLKLKNNTNHNILIQVLVDLDNYRLVFDLYGQSDGRKVLLTKPQIWDQTPPPADLYQDDPALPKGQTKQVDFSAWGAKSSFNYKVTKNDQVLWEKTFYSSYRPWQAVYLRGTRE